MRTNTLDPLILDSNIFAYVYPSSTDCAAAFKTEHNQPRYDADNGRVVIHLKPSGNGKDAPIRRSLTGWSFGKNTLTADVVVADPGNAQVGHFDIALTMDYRIQFQRSTETKMGVRLKCGPETTEYDNTFYPGVKEPILIALAPHHTHHWTSVEILAADGVVWCEIEFPNHNTRRGIQYAQFYAGNLNWWLDQLVVLSWVPAADTRSLAIRQAGPGNIGNTFWYGKLMFAGSMHRTVLWIDLKTGASSIKKTASGIEDLRGSKSWKQGHLRRQKGRLTHEIRMSKKHKHAHLISLLYFQFDPDPCLVTPYYDTGGDDKMVLNPDQARVACWQLIEALDFLHSNNVVHRNLHPGKIFVESFDPFKIVVTGWATAAYVSPTMPPLSSGDRRLAYIAPEMPLVDERPKKKDPLEDAPYTTAIDIWSAGLIVLGWNCGYREFRYDTDPRIIDSRRQHLVKLIENISAENPDDKVMEMVTNMVQIDPATRYTAKECLSLDRSKMKFVERDETGEPKMALGMLRSIVRPLPLTSAEMNDPVPIVPVPQTLAESVCGPVTNPMPRWPDQMTVSAMSPGAKWAACTVSVPSTVILPESSSVWGNI